MLICSIFLLFYLEIKTESVPSMTTPHDYRLADVAPSILRIMGLEQPADMTGECLIQDSLSVGNYGFLVMKLPFSRNETLTQLVPACRSN